MVPRLRKLMIRHTKAQVIGAGQALSLPSLASKTVMLSMDAATQETYTQAVRQFTCGGSSRYHSLCQKGSSVFGVNMALSPIMAICYTASAKIDALCNDLEELQHTERHPHAVVFTHSQSQHKNIVEELNSRLVGFAIYEFTGSTDPKRRHASIRQFQERENKPKVFVITIRAGNVGITLTAATRVYLMEPCLHPAHEIQAAGRIHRLGQNEDVLVTRFCFKDSFEQEIVKLHEQIAEGLVEISEQHVPGIVVNRLIGAK